MQNNILEFQNQNQKLLNRNKSNGDINQFNPIKNEKQYKNRLSDISGAEIEDNSLDSEKKSGGISPTNPSVIT